MLKYIIALTVFIGSCQADSIVTATAGWYASGVNPIGCLARGSGQGGAVSSSCAGQFAEGEIITSFSNAGNYYLIPSFGGTVEASTDATVDSFSRVTATASYSEQLVVPGTGSGTLILNFAMMGQGFDDFAVGGAEMVFSATGLTGFGPWGPGTCPGGGAPDMFICQQAGQYPGQLLSYYTETSSIPITLGVPFTFTEQLMLYASGNDGIPAYGWVTADGNGLNWSNGSCGVPFEGGGLSIPCGYASVSLLNYSVLDANGNPIPGAMLADPPGVPEPATWLCVLTATLLLGCLHWSRLYRRQSAGCGNTSR
jgi:hypothetical protein